LTVSSGGGGDVMGLLTVGNKIKFVLLSNPGYKFSRPKYKFDRFMQGGWMLYQRNFKLNATLAGWDLER